jgi:hypothetical protein
MYSRQKAFGWMSTPEKASRTRTRKKLREQFFYLPATYPSYPHCWSQVEGVSMRIGRWFKRWDMTIGPTEVAHSSVFVMLTVYTLMGAELRILRRYYALREPETESTTLRRLSDGEAPLVPTDLPI